MKKSVEGVCEECGNTGIVKETCMACGGRIVSLDDGLDQFESDEEPIVSPKSSKKSPAGGLDDDTLDELDEFEDDDDEDDLDNELEDSDTASIEELAEEEGAESEKEAAVDNKDDDEE